MLKDSVTLLPSQKRALPFHLKNPYSINADEMGLGKSITSLATAEYAKAKKILVVCPAFLKHNWKNEVRKFTDRVIKGTVEDTGNNWSVQIESYTGLKKVKDFAAHDYVILDEAHYVKNPQAQRTKLLHDLVEKNRPRRLMLLTGTPVQNRTTEMWSLLRLVWLGGSYPEFSEFSSSYYKFCATFSNMKKFRLAGRQITKYECMRNTDRLLEMIRPIYRRFKAKDVLDLPEQNRSEVMQEDKSRLDMDLADAWDRYEGGSEDKKSFSKIKAVNALSKVSYTRDFVINLLDSTDRVIIWSDHVQAARALAQEFPGKARFVSGETPVAKRAEYVDMFEEGKFPVLVATVGSLSTGVNLTSCSYMVFNDFPWVPASLDQAEKRIHRHGQTRKCFYYYILGSKVDKRILSTINKKRNLVDTLVESNK